MQDDYKTYQRIHKLLSSLSSFELVALVVKKVFQRVPALAERLIEEAKRSSNSKQKQGLVSAFLHKIEYLVENENETRKLGLPRKLSDYLRFIDLLVVVQRSNYKTWQVYLLKGFQTVKNSDASWNDDLYSKRNALKTWLSERGHISSIQTEIDENRVWFSLSFTEKTGDRSKDRARLQASKTFYIVHYSGEPNFYFSVNRIPEILSEALASCFDATEFMILPLSGKNIESLRQLRLNRGGNSNQISQKIGHERFSCFNHENTKRQDHPMLNQVRTECNLSFQGLADDEEISRALRGKKMRIRFECRGKDVIGGLNDLVAEGFFQDNTTPQWVVNLPTAGRNLFTLVDEPRKETDWELQSVLSSASTVANATMNRSRK